MKRLILTTFIILFAFVAWAQPPIDPIGSLQFDTLFPGKDNVLRCEIRHNGVTLPTVDCQYTPLNGVTKVSSPNGYPPGPHEFEVRVYYEAFTYIDPTTGAETVFNEGWSGWSNIAAATKPETLALKSADGYIVTDPQPGAISGMVYIDGAEYPALAELSPDGLNLRLFDMSTLLPGTYNVYSNITISFDNTNFWAGSYQQVPFVVTVGVALPVPANLRIVQ